MVLNGKRKRCCKKHQVRIRELNAQNPGLQREVKAHEETHGDEYYEAAAKTSVSLKFGNKAYKGTGDEVLTGIYKDYQTGLKADVDKKIKANSFADQKALDTYVASQNAQFGKKFEGAAKDVFGQMQGGVLAEFDKSKKTQTEVNAIENRVNNKAIPIKLGGKAPYLTGQKQVINKGKVVPSN